MKHPKQNHHTASGIVGEAVAIAGLGVAIAFWVSRRDFFPADAIVFPGVGEAAAVPAPKQNHHTAGGIVGDAVVSASQWPVTMFLPRSGKRQSGVLQIF